MYFVWGEEFNLIKESWEIRTVTKEDKIWSCVCAHFETTLSKLGENTRLSRRVWPRMIASYLLWEKDGKNPQQIMESYKKKLKLTRDRSVFYSHIDKIQGLLDIGDARTTNDINSIHAIMEDRIITTSVTVCGCPLRISYRNEEDNISIADVQCKNNVAMLRGIFGQAGVDFLEQIKTEIIRQIC